MFAPMIVPVVLSTDEWKIILKELLASEVALSKKDAQKHRAIVNLILAFTEPYLKEGDILKEMEEDGCPTPTN